jgi:4-amino-4-deoxy-L-arabinose transferase-like glycosyltransferase
MDTLTVTTPESPAPASAAKESPAKVSQRVSSLENWLQSHLTAIALVLVAAGFVLRVLAARGTFLNPDEALQYMQANQRSTFLAYKASLTNAHPPLLFLVLYFWEFLGRSEWMLRMPSVLAGTTCCWLSFKWIGRLFGNAAGLIGLVLLTFAPSMIDLSAELRQYALLLMCTAGALLALIKAFEENSARAMWLSSILLSLAILSHYGAVFVIAALTLYALVRIADSQASRKVILAWVSGQAIVLAVFAFVYYTHVAKVKNSRIPAWSSPFQQYFFHWQDGDLFFFLRENTSNIFLYSFKEHYVSAFLLILFLLGVIYLFATGLFPRSEQRRSGHLGILLVLPFMAAWAGAIGGIYPYIGSRHTIFLVPFAVAGVSVALAVLTRQKLWAGVLVALALMGVSHAYGKPSAGRIPRKDQDRLLMVSAVNYVHEAVSKNEIIVTDYQSSLLGAYYLCGPKQITGLENADAAFQEVHCDGYTMVALSSALWKLKPENFTAQTAAVIRAYNLKPGTRFWIFQAGWGRNLDKELPASDAKWNCISAKTFGANISVLSFVVGADFLPAVPTGSCVAGQAAPLNARSGLAGSASEEQ